MKKNRISFIAKVGVFSAIAFVLQFVGKMLPAVSNFLEIEPSELPALIISFALGPVAGVAVEFIKNLLHCPVTTTGFVGEFANFVVNGLFVFVAGFIYQKNKTKKGAVISLIAGTLVMVVVGALVNMFIMLPLFMRDADFYVKLNLVLFTVSPFNLVRGSALSLITILIYKRISGLLK